MILEGFFSGLRGDIPLSVLENLRADDVDRFADYLAIEFGNSADTIARKYKSYIDIRKNRYRVSDNQPAVFLSLPTGPTGAVGRLTVRSSQKMLERYVEAFGKPSLSIHKLRHTFATKFHQENNDLAKLKGQLGHSDMNTTMIYTHIGQEDQLASVNKTDS